jgi:hypothetical protein
VRRPCCQEQCSNASQQQFFSWLHIRALAFVDAIEPKHVVVLISQQLLNRVPSFPTAGVVILLYAHHDATEIHQGMVATRRDTDTTAIAFDSTPKRIRWREVFQVRTLPSVRRLLFTAYSTGGLKLAEPSRAMRAGRSTSHDK